jgi:formamidopyrimidine-DNA glycosylase
MPELPEVEVLVRHLGPLLEGQAIRGVEVRRPRIVRPNSVEALRRALVGSVFADLTRRGKYLLFSLRRAGGRETFTLLGHLGMTGRMFLLPAKARLPKHAAVVLRLARHQFVFEDPRYFGRLTLDTGAVSALGPEPLDDQYAAAELRDALRRSRQPLKVKLLDQSVVAGIGNIYASEALFRARLSPRLRADRLSDGQARRLWRSVRQVLREAIARGSTVRLHWGPGAGRDGLFYYGAPEGESGYRHEPLRVYDRAGQPCLRCGSTIRQMLQAARSTYYCPRCQRSTAGPARGNAPRGSPRHSDP